ncbi:MAG: L-rhamnose isomerase [Lentisphaerae bacterium]|nr:MAG: L-rhamnose isomerase [Lentisphaerota bacterium]
MNSLSHLEKNFESAKEIFAEYGIDCEAAMEILDSVAISVHCWQGDDVAGFEPVDAHDGGGLQVTGNYPGKARNADELRQDAEKVFSLVPGKHRFNLHAIYAETDGRKVSRNELDVSHFQRWIDWAAQQGIGLDFNGTFFRHPLADDGFTLSSADEAKRQFWIEHGIASRRIAAAMGKTLGTPAVCNVWIPDGMKDLTFDRRGPRERLLNSLDAIFAEELSSEHVKDAVESKLFGIGSESYVVGSHEFYLGYACSRQKMLCLDMGHFHPTESIADKISSTLLFLPGVLLHVSRGVRWDSDHVVILNDELQNLCNELVRNNYLNRVAIGLDFFDASINRIAAWTIGIRAVQRALLTALLEPAQHLEEAERSGDYSTRLLLFQESHNLPVSAVWNYYCLKSERPVGNDLLAEIKNYEKNVLSQRA